MSETATDTPKPIGLALQGGGAHGAFTWGVLDTLLADGRLAVEGISGTSAGAMNGTMVAEGLMRGGTEGARESLDRFWGRIAQSGRFGPFARTPFDAMCTPWSLERTPGYILFDAVSRYLSPYQFNPLNLNPLLDILEQDVDFDAVRHCDAVKLFVSATSVRSGKIRVFEGAELTPQAVMASAALPQVFQAVEVEGEPFWDGGYMGNPAIFPLIYNCEARDILLVQVNPIERADTPRTMPEIQDRLNEITFNATLMREMRAIAFVTDLLDSHAIDSHKYKRLRLHRIDVPADMAALDVSTKFNAERPFLDHLRALGHQAARDWLDAHAGDVGHRDTIDIATDYL